jgi:hypothetical protein
VPILYENQIDQVKQGQRSSEHENNTLGQRNDLGQFCGGFFQCFADTCRFVNDLRNSGGNVMGTGLRRIGLDTKFFKGVAKLLVECFDRWHDTIKTKRPRSPERGFDLTADS